MAKVKKTMKKAQTGKNVPKGMVESEMFPGKMIPKSKSNYYNGEYNKMVETGRSRTEAARKAFDAKAKAKPKAQNGKTVNTQRTKGSDPLSSYSPNIKRYSGSGNLIPVGAKKHPVTGKPLSAPKSKSGGSFPDLNKDGKITKADILKGRGVIAKKGAKVSAMKKCKYGCK